MGNPAPALVVDQDHENISFQDQGQEEAEAEEENAIANENDQVDPDHDHNHENPPTPPSPTVSIRRMREDTETVRPPGKPWWIWVIGFLDIFMVVLMVMWTIHVHTTKERRNSDTVTIDQHVGMLTSIAMMFSFTVQFTLGGLLIISLSAGNESILTLFLNGYVIASYFLICNTALVLITTTSMMVTTTKNQFGTEGIQRFVSSLAGVIFRIPQTLLVQGLLNKYTDYILGQNEHDEWGYLDLREQQCRGWLLDQHQLQEHPEGVVEGEENEERDEMEEERAPPIPIVRLERESAGNIESPD